jgi:fructose-1,6-bisphosphatase/inositol monophosphatase family enzyme
MPMNPQDLVPWLPAVRSLLLSRQAAILHAHAAGACRVSIKNGSDIVTDLDTSLQSQLTGVLEKFGARVLGEEGDTGWPPDRADGDVVLVDPVDGTENFAGRVPCFGTMLVAFRDMEPWASVVWIPLDSLLSGDGFYLAVRGQGAWRCRIDGTLFRVRVSGTRSLGLASVAVEGPSKAIASSPLAPRLGTRCRTMRLGLSSSWCGTRLASGADCGAPIDALVAIDSQPWDTLPIALLIQEAGGRVTDFDGRPFDGRNYRNLAMSNGHVHEEILRCIHEK